LQILPSRLLFRRNDREPTPEETFVPLYDYLCESCGKKFEEFRNLAERHNAPCPVCGKPADKQLSGFFTSGGSGSASRDPGNCGPRGFG
jgi:putative FmdB family regulatory protein